MGVWWGLASVPCMITWKEPSTGADMLFGCYKLRCDGEAG